LGQQLHQYHQTNNYLSLQIIEYKNGQLWWCKPRSWLGTGKRNLGGGGNGILILPSWIGCLIDTWKVSSTICLYVLYWQIKTVSNLTSKFRGRYYLPDLTNNCLQLRINQVGSFIKTKSRNKHLFGTKMVLTCNLQQNHSFLV
jgi:hypothetical protein